MLHMLCAKSVAPMQDLACSGFHGHVGGRFRRICTGTTRSLRSARLGDRKGRARKDAIFNAKKAARQAGAACCHSVGGRRLDQLSTRPTYRLSCGCSTTNASSRRMNAAAYRGARGARPSAGWPNGHRLNGLRGVARWKRGAKKQPVQDAGLPRFPETPVPFCVPSPAESNGNTSQAATGTSQPATGALLLTI